MPIKFSSTWNDVGLKLLAEDELKQRMLALKADAALRVDSLLAIRKQEVSNLEAATGGNAKAIAARKERLESAQLGVEKLNEFKNKGEITARLVKEMGVSADDFRTKNEATAGTKLNSKDLGWRIMAVNNELKRLSDQAMLTQYTEVDIRAAMQAAAQDFHSIEPPGAMMERAIALGGDEVEVTQGVHQSNDPHFDVLSPGVATQMHVNVTLSSNAPRLKIVSIGYMKDGMKYLLMPT